MSSQCVITCMVNVSCLMCVSILLCQCLYVIYVYVYVIICVHGIYPINLIDKDFNTLSILCNNKQRCFPYCFGDVISVNSLSKTQLEQAICLLFLLEHIPLIDLILKLKIMLSLMLGFPVALSDAKDWTPVKKGIALIWIGLLDTLIIGLCCW